MIPPAEVATVADHKQHEPTNRRNRRPYDPPPAAEAVARGERPWKELPADTFYLPGETTSETLAEFVEWYGSLTEGGGTGGGANYAGVRVSDIRHTAEIVMRRLMHLRFGAGDDILFVGGEQADRCRDCIGNSREKTEEGSPMRQLCRKGGP